MITSVKRTISFTNTTLKALQNFVPKYEKSKLVDTVVKEALEKFIKERALAALENVRTMDAYIEGLSIVETLRVTRQETSNRLGKK